MGRFFAIDVETANSAISSICQIGLVGFESGEEIFARSWIVNPDDWFDPINVSIHGIDENRVFGSPLYCDIYKALAEIVENEILVSHTHFDRGSLLQASTRYSLPPLDCLWLDSARVARRAWTQFAQRGYGLANLASFCEISFQHHDATEDARTTGKILLRAIDETGIQIEDWFSRTRQPVNGYQSVKRLGDGDGALAGETVVFTGALVIPRRDAADRAAKAGADVQTTVSKNTTLLVVGDRDVSKFAGKAKSSKHMKAEHLIAEGQEIRIIGETDFLALSSITE